MSFRQEWPITPCDYVECEDTVTDDGDGTDPCDDKEGNEEEGPLDRFEQSMKNYMTMDIWGREVPKHKHSAHPSLLSRTTANTVSTTEDLATEDLDNRAFAKKLANIEKHFMYEQALMFAEKAAEEAPPELVEEAALASARGYTMTVESVRKPMVTGDSVIEVLSYLGITKPVATEYIPDCS